MFYKVTLQKLVTVPPEKLDAALHRHLLQILRDAVVGQHLSVASTPSTQNMQALQLAYRAAAKSSAVIVAVVDILGAEDLQGVVLDNGCVSFLLPYDALVLKAHPGEVLDVQVESVAPGGWNGSVFGLGSVFVSQKQMSSEREGWSYEQGEESWVSADGGRSIRVGDLVRIRVLAETPQSDAVMLIGTMAGPYLGPL